MQFKLNNRSFNVGVASVARRLRKEEKYRVTTEDGVIHREVKATYVDFDLTLGNLDQAAYNGLVNFLETANDDITLILDANQYQGVFDDITDSASHEEDGGVVWDTLSLSFTGTKPLRREV